LEEFDGTDVIHRFWYAARTAFSMLFSAKCFTQAVDWPYAMAPQALEQFGAVISMFSYLFSSF